MSNHIDRLKASKEKQLGGLRDQGKSEGYNWGRDHAEYLDLVALDDLETDDLETVESGAEVLEFIKSTLPNGDEMSHAEFMEVMFGTASFPHQSAFAIGFVHGVQKFYREVQDQL